MLPNGPVYMIDPTYLQSQIPPMKFIHINDPFWEIIPPCLACAERLSELQICYQFFGGLAVFGLLEAVLFDFAEVHIQYALSEELFYGYSPYLYGGLACYLATITWIVYGPFTITF